MDYCSAKCQCFVCSSSYYEPPFVYRSCKLQKSHATTLLLRGRRSIVDCDKIQNKSLLYNYFPITIDPTSPTKTTQTTYAFFTACGQVKPSGGKVGGSHLQHVPSIDL